MRAMDMMLDSDCVHIVETGEDLAEAVEWFSHCSEISVDTESDSLFVYYEKVCLIQFTAEGRSYIIDPLVTGDLSPLAPIFSSSEITKIFHAAEYDLMCLKRDYGFNFANLFDTMIAARILSKKEFGLGALIENEFDIHMEKKFQKANWGLRPLSDEMLLYATSDTRFLGMLKDKLEKELKERGLLELAHEDFIRLCETPAGSSEPISINWWKAAGNHELTFYQTAVLQNLCEMREAAAMKRDLPPFKIVQNEVLLEIALNTPENESKLRKIKGIPASFLRRYSKQILSIVQHSKSTHTIPRPVSPPRPCNGILSRKERLKAWRKNQGLSMDVPSDVILPKDILERIALDAPQTPSELQTIMTACPWRYQHFGEEILQVSLNSEIISDSAAE